MVANMMKIFHPRFVLIVGVTLDMTKSTDEAQLVEHRRNVWGARTEQPL